jgi:hypothetical protein
MNLENKKIAILKCPSNLNLGNEFIDNGGIYLLKDIFKDNYCIEDFEVLDTSQDNGVINNINILDYLETFEYLFILSGSLISDEGFLILKKILNIKGPKKILLGIGCYRYNKKEQMICKFLEKKYDYIFTRDNLTFSYFENKKNNVFLSIDLAFYLNNYVSKINNNNNNNKYAVINIGDIPDCLSQIKKELNELKEKYKYVYIVENTSYRCTLKDFKYDEELYNHYVFYTFWESLYRLYQNADYVVTMRIHTSIVCLSNNIKFKYVGNDEGGKIGRNVLFNKFIKLEKNKEYYLTNKIEEIEEEKTRFKELLKKILL